MNFSGLQPDDARLPSPTKIPQTFYTNSALDLNYRDVANFSKKFEFQVERGHLTIYYTGLILIKLFNLLVGSFNKTYKEHNFFKLYVDNFFISEATM